MSIKIANDTANGSITLKGQNVAGDKTITMPNLDCELAPRMQLMTAQNSTSGTAIDFIGIPSWAKRVTVMFNGVSTNGTSSIQVQLGTSGGVQTTLYNTAGHNFNSSTLAGTWFTSGVVFGATNSVVANRIYSGVLNIVNLSLTSWCYIGAIANSDDSHSRQTNGGVTLSGTLDRIRITTVNGTDIFDAGIINVMYEG